VDTLLKKTEKSYHFNAKGDLSIYTFSARKKVKDYSRRKKQEIKKPWIPTNPRLSTFFFRSLSSLAPLGTSGI
jgi:hypothetical protein